MNHLEQLQQHGDPVPFIREKMGDGMYLKAAIEGVLELVPNVFRLDFPEVWEADMEDYEPTAEQEDAMAALNMGLIVPIHHAAEIAVIIRHARDFGALATATDSRETNGGGRG